MVQVLSPEARSGTPSGGFSSGEVADSAGMAEETSGSSVRWVGLAIDCEAAPPMARFYEQLLGFKPSEVGPRWAQLWDPQGGVHLNIQGDSTYVPPTWPEKPDEQAKMMHFEVRVDDLEAAVALAIEAGGTQAPWQPPDRNPERIRIMLDPAGHPLCLFLRGE